jgi:hypothetical protein
MDPGFPREPGVISVADRTTGAREKYRAAPKALAIDLDAGGDRAPGLRALDHDHPHANLPRSGFNAFLKKEPAGWIASYRCAVTKGGITHLPVVVEHWVGRVLVAGLSPTGRITLRAAF